MTRITVAFFSPDATAHHSTRDVAKLIQEITDADFYEIKPAEPYNEEDLDWEDKTSRSSMEMADSKSRPELADKNATFEDYDIIYLGFPIWWYVAPHIINTFLETYDFSGKTIVTFATSGGSSWGDTLKYLKPSSPNAKFIEGKVFRGTINKDTLTEWIKTIDF